jgi:SAM-dependent methyltransferase
MSRSLRVDYDAIAPLYDEQPYRAKTVDPELTAFIGQHTPAVLDIGCGTGSQLVANRTATPGARLVGVDRSLGMLQQARAKAADIFWVLADAASLPFDGSDFDSSAASWRSTTSATRWGHCAPPFESCVRADASCCAICARSNRRTGSIMNISQRPKSWI